MNKSEFITELYVNKSYDKLKQHYTETEDFAKVLFLSGDYTQAAKLYKKLGMPFNEGYCYLLTGDIKKTRALWKNLDENNPQITWGKALLNILDPHLGKSPTFFELRNFLEIDLGYFIMNERYDYIIKIIDALWWLVQINTECYKYLGRAFINHGDYANGKVFIEKAKETCCNDPEAHILLAKCYMETGEYELAKKSVENCLQVAPHYYPALNFFK